MEETAAEGTRLCNSIPILGYLRRDGHISPDHRNNKICRFLSQEEQKTQYSTHRCYPKPSGSYIFYNIASDGESFPSGEFYNVHHGNIDGNGLGPILKNCRIRPYMYSKGREINKGECLVTPSWVVASSVYGFEYEGGSILHCRMWLLLEWRKGGQKKSFPNTASFESMDWFHPHDEIEWSVLPKDIIVRGLVVKQYYRNSIPSHNLSSHRNAHMKNVKTEFKTQRQESSGDGKSYGNTHEVCNRPKIDSHESKKIHRQKARRNIHEGKRKKKIGSHSRFGRRSSKNELSPQREFTLQHHNM